MDYEQTFNASQQNNNKNDMRLNVDRAKGKILKKKINKISVVTVHNFVVTFHY